MAKRADPKSLIATVEEGNVQGVVEAIREIIQGEPTALAEAFGAWAIWQRPEAKAELLAMLAYHSNEVRDLLPGSTPGEMFEQPDATYTPF